MNVAGPVKAMTTLMSYGASAPNVARGTRRAAATSASEAAVESDVFIAFFPCRGWLEVSAELAHRGEGRCVGIPAHDDHVFGTEAVRIEIFEVVDAGDSREVLLTADPIPNLLGARVRPNGAERVDRDHRRIPGHPVLHVVVEPVLLERRGERVDRALHLRVLSHAGDVRVALEV